MEKDKLYVFYNNIYHFGRDKDKVLVGKYIGDMKDEDVMIFELPEGGMRFSTDVHDKLNPGNNVFNFIEYLAEKFQNKFKRDVSVWHEDYEFKIKFEHLNDRVLDDIENAMNGALEDWWSVTWEELEYNSIQCKRESVIVSFRVHDVHEVQFKYYDERNA